MYGAAIPFHVSTSSTKFIAQRADLQEILIHSPKNLQGAITPQRTLTCNQVLSWAAVVFRLHTRFRVVREPRWDDYIVFVAAVFNLAAMASFPGGAPTQHRVVLLAY